MDKLDLKKEYKSLFTASAKEASEIVVPELNYFMVDGEGDPNNSPVFQEAAGLLYGLSYTLKFMIKKQNLGPDYSVMALEGLWWSDDMKCFDMDNKDIWKWTLMILQPDFITKDLYKKAKAEVEKKKGISFEKVRFEKFHEGLSAQIMHIGPYATEGPTVQKLHDFIKESGRSLRGIHHEIYLGDPRKAKPEKLKTIIRQPIK